MAPPQPPPKNPWTPHRMTPAKQLLPRDQVKPADAWDLSSLFADDVRAGSNSFNFDLAP